MPHAWPPGDDDTDANQDNREEDSKQPEFTIEECIEALEEIREADRAVKEDTAERLLETDGGIRYNKRTYKAVDPAADVSSSPKGDPKEPEKLEKLRFLKQETDYFERAQVNDLPLRTHDDQYKAVKKAVRDLDTKNIDVHGIEHQQSTFGDILQYLDEEEGREKAREVAYEVDSFAKAGLFGSPELGKLFGDERLGDTNIDIDLYLDSPGEFPPRKEEQDLDAREDGYRRDHQKLKEALDIKVNFRTDYISSEDSDDAASDDGSKYLL